jgi:hypothetical protein
MRSNSSRCDKVLTKKSVPQIWLSKGGGNNLLSVGTPGFGEQRIWLPRTKADLNEGE